MARSIDREKTNEGSLIDSGNVRVSGNPAPTGAGVPPTEDVAAQALFARGEQFYDAEDFAKAKECFEQAAELGYGPAQSSFAYMLATGPQDYEKARHWWEQAASQGDIDAQLNLGKVYLTGRGAPKNLTKARQWFGKAAAQGDVEAQACLHWLKDIGIGYEN
jgi:TPR repeat protein